MWMNQRQKKKKKEAEGKVQERKVGKQSKSSEGNEGFSLVDPKKNSKNATRGGSSVYIGFNVHQIKTSFPCFGLAFFNLNPA